MKGELWRNKTAAKVRPCCPALHAHGHSLLPLLSLFLFLFPSLFPFFVL